MRRTICFSLLAFFAIAGTASANPWLDRPFLNQAHQGGELEAPATRCSR